MLTLLNPTPIFSASIMVIICTKPYVYESDAERSMHELYSNGLQLSDFQKWAAKAIFDGDHVLVTAHTGSGKTLPAEIAIQYFTSKPRQKKVIYASPIKALSNQKLFDMRRKFPHISFGILTGDCKDNPEADVLIMTTEILRNTLLNKKINKKTADAQVVCPPDHAGGACGCNSDITTTLLPLLFQMDFETELAAVIFDEVHYINDAERGAVWEQAILLLPPQVQLIMLSATIDRPEEFAGWIEDEKRKQTLHASVPKQLYLAGTNTRVVPLTHYMWLALHEGTMKKSAKTPYANKLEYLWKNETVIASADGVFHENNYYKVKDVLDYLSKNNIYAKRQFVLEDLLKHLKESKMLPAICFIFSRKHVEKAANEISFTLFDTDDASVLPARIEQECRHILQSKIANYKEYLELPEYATILKLLQKGVAIHHAGIIPVLREMVELLFEKGYIRLLIATETFAVGLNMPTKTVIFAGLTKFNGHTMRLLFPHEYTQMAGRAGRRGLDTVGHVFHCVNLFEPPTVTEYRHMLTGPPQTLTSKFKVSFNLTLAMLNANQDIAAFMEQSLLSADIRQEVKGYENAGAKYNDMLVAKKEQLMLCRTPVAVLEKYRAGAEAISGLANSARKKARIELNNIEVEHKFLTADLARLDAFYTTQTEQLKNAAQKTNTVNYIQTTIDALMKILANHAFIVVSGDDNRTICEKGRVAAQLQEVHPLALTDLYYEMQQLATFDATMLAGLFSCFYPVSVSDEFRAHYPAVPPSPLRNAINYIAKQLQHYVQCEQEAFLDTGANYDICYDLLPYVMRWCESDDELTCKTIIRDLKTETGLFVGEFIKALLKINAVAQELERVCELVQNIALLVQLRQIPTLTLKYIATNQSLYL
jgi:superfamily II RNA helicase